MRNRTIWHIIWVCGLSVFAFSSASSFPDDYDHLIRKAQKTWLPGIDWRLYKAQLYKESRLDPEAISPVGAQGLAQIMPSTWGDLSQAMGLEGVSPFMADPAIQAGAYYMAQRRRGWSSPRPEWDRHSLALASYNAGFGNMLKAQKACGMAVEYKQIVRCLSDITGDHSKETTTYVDRIWTYFKMMVAGVGD